MSADQNRASFYQSGIMITWITGMGGDGKILVGMGIGISMKLRGRDGCGKIQGKWQGEENS